MAKYHEVFKDIREKIMTAYYEKGSQLPKQEELKGTYSTSRVTIQRALNLLQMEGLIVTKKGQGTFVSETVSTHFYLDSQISNFQGSTSELEGKGQITSEIISFDIRLPDEVETEKLQISKEKLVYDIIRLRKLDDEPLILEYTIMTFDVIPNLTVDILEKSIYQYIQKDLKLVIGSAVRRIHADRADAYDKKYLDCTPIDPILEIDQVAFLNDGTPFEYSQTRHRFDKGDIIFTSSLNQ
ncbi:GntR family transcriptional regulator [Marinilactibacillus sp. GCM10026970]|uniref:GntR family transcriptional regulator n=1 Tax=Marinilactibacillus sp. GCM10026970 TaxID=3252642 RepID=UPI00360AACBA